MAKFRKKPVVIEATQFLLDAPRPEGVCEGDLCTPLQGLPHVHTLEGLLKVSDFDWIITGVKGERYPCKPDIFAATYEPAGEGEKL
jgi:hypothetical protein